MAPTTCGKKSTAIFSSLPAPTAESRYSLEFVFDSLSLPSTAQKLQMTDSYTSSRDGDYSNGIPNGSTTSFGQPIPPATGISSVIRKKLMGYVGFANLPNQVHRKSVRKGFQFTAMVVGKSPTGSFFRLNFNFSTRRVGFGQVNTHQHLVQHYSLSPQRVPGSFCGEAQNRRH